MTTGFIILACQKDPDPYIFPDPSTLPTGLKGTWLETTTRLDTIIFSNSDNRSTLWLKNNFNNIKFTGFYPYQISEDSIFVRDPLSSSSEIGDGINFYFKFDEPTRTMTIGNFTYRLSAKEPLLIFKKIK
jgi:hypothetical protein